MRKLNIVSALLVSVILASCGGGSGGSANLPAKPKFTAQVSFGDSLSDVGSYKVGPILAAGGGQFTINVPGQPTNWTELTAISFGLPLPCAAQKGIDNGGVPAGFVVATVNNPACTGYAQGGARVTNPIGIGNKAVPVVAPATPGLALTVPVVTQIANHLAAHGNFTGSEIVFVMAGANDVFAQLGALSAGANAAALAAVAPTTPTAAAAAYMAANVPIAAAALATEAANLAGYVNTQMIAKGAKYVVVMNIPDIASTPQGTAVAVSAPGVVNILVNAYNNQLKTSLPDTANILNIDAYTASKDEVANPVKYNLTNVTGVACAVASSLTCSAANPPSLNPGVTAASKYLFADGVHPTPYGHQLFALAVTQAMTAKGWY